MTRTIKCQHCQQEKPLYEFGGQLFDAEICEACNDAYAEESFGTLFGEWCKAIGIDKTAHGLRKLASTEIAQGGGSEMHLQAAMGWSTVGQSSVYTRTARQDTLAKEAMKKRMANISIPKPFLPLPNLKNSKGKSK